MPFWPLPHIPDNTALMKMIYLKPNNDSVMIQSFNFLADSTPTTFDMATAWKHDAAPWITNAITRTYSQDVSFSYFWFFYKWGSVIHSSGDSAGAGMANPVHYPGPCIDTTICGCWSRRTSIPGGNTTGRVYSMPLPKAFIDGNYLSLTGRGELGTAAAHHIDAWTSQGVTFSPALWSQQLGNCYALRTVGVLDKISRVYKRRIIHPYVRPFLLWPLVP